MSLNLLASVGSGDRHAVAASYRSGAHVGARHRMPLKFRVPPSRRNVLSGGQRLILALIVWIGAFNAGAMLSELLNTAIFGDHASSSWGFGLGIAFLSLFSGCFAAPIIAWSKWRFHNVFLVVASVILACFTAYFVIYEKPII